MAKTGQEIAYEEWAAEISRLNLGDKGLTSRELAKAFGKPHRTVLEILRRGLKSGEYARGFAARTDSLGRVQRVPVYRVKGAKK